MGGWTIQAREDGCHEVLYLDDETTEEALRNAYSADVPVEEIITMVLQRAKEGDWIIGPNDYGVMVVAAAKDEASKD